MPIEPTPASSVQRFYQNNRAQLWDSLDDSEVRHLLAMHGQDELRRRYGSEPVVSRIERMHAAEQANVAAAMAANPSHFDPAFDSLEATERAPQNWRGWSQEDLAGTRPAPVEPAFPIKFKHDNAEGVIHKTKAGQYAGVKFANIPALDFMQAMLMRRNVDGLPSYMRDLLRGQRVKNVSATVQDDLPNVHLMLDTGTQMERTPEMMDNRRHWGDRSAGRTPEGFRRIGQEVLKRVEGLEDNTFLAAQGATDDLQQSYDVMLKKRFPDRFFKGRTGIGYIAPEKMAKSPDWGDLKKIFGRTFPAIAGLTALAAGNPTEAAAMVAPPVIDEMIAPQAVADATLAGQAPPVGSSMPSHGNFTRPVAPTAPNWQRWYGRTY